MVVALVLSTIATLSAQNSASTTSSSEFSNHSEVVPKSHSRSFTEGSSLVPPSVLQAVARAKRSFSEGHPHDQIALSSPPSDLRVAVSAGAQPYQIEENSLQAGLIQMATVARLSNKSEKMGDDADCKAVAIAVEQRVKLDVSQVLEIVESEVGANPTCACEIVKISIMTSNADVAQVVAIVEAAINAAPDSMRIISQCAIATVPEAIAEVQALLAELDPNSGDGEGSSAKSAKSAKSTKGGEDAEVAAMVAPMMENPLDRPFMPTLIPVIVPLHVTNVNP